MRTALFDRALATRTGWPLMALVAALGMWLSLASSPALAATEAHPRLGGFGSFTNPNGIAVDESTGDVYVADLATNTVSKFNANGEPIESWGTKGQLDGSATPAKSFLFPAGASGTPAAIAVDNSRSLSDPSAGDLYVMDAGHGVIDKFGAGGEYLSQITGFTPAMGSPETEKELLGLAVDGGGDVRVDLRPEGLSRATGVPAVDLFDDSVTNVLIAKQLNYGGWETVTSGMTSTFPEAGFGVGPGGDDYFLLQSCSCVVKTGQQLAELGQVDKPHSGDVALVADPATGHLYIDNQSSVTEWDTGAMNGSHPIANTNPVEYESSGVQVGTPFGSLSGSSGQGGIAVNGSSGAIYVSNPGEGKVEIFGSDVPAVAAGAASGVTKEAASLNGTVDPRGASLASCRFDYGVANEFGQGEYSHSVPCTPAAGDIAAGSTAVAVSAQIGGLQPGLLYRFRLVAGNANGSGETSGLVATAPAGFGIKKFEVNFLNRDGSPDTQAGSHPYKMTNNIEFNSHFQPTEPQYDSPYVREPDGTLKDLSLDLPPGLVGDPNATAEKCTVAELRKETRKVTHEELGGAEGGTCPVESFIGSWQVEYSKHISFGGYVFDEPIYNMVAPYGVAVQLGVHYDLPDLFINSGVLAGGDYPVQASVSSAPPAAPVIFSRVTIFGVAGSGSTRKPFLTLPTGCHGPLRSSISMDSYQEPGRLVKDEAVTTNSAGTPVSLSGCSLLQFPPTISVKPDTSFASSSSGLTVGVHVPQTAAKNPDGLAESSLRDTTVTLPEGMALNPSGGDGLENCSEGLAGFKGVEEFNPEFEPGVKTAEFTPTPLASLAPGSSTCPDGSKIGTVKLKTPLLEHELEGSMYLAAQNSNPFGSLVAMYMLIEDPVSGSTVKLTGEVRLTEAGQIITTFKNTPDLPFEDLELHFFGGERAPLTTPSRCGTYTTTAVFTPWDGNAPVTSTSSFQIDHGPSGEPCPGASLPFTPSLTGGSTNVNAGGFSALTTTIGREDGQQDLQSVQLHMPAGLEGLLSNVKLCPEAQANEGTCGPESQIGETTVSAGVGSDPVTVNGGRVYITEKYAGAPFGLSIVNPVKAGPFDLEHDTANPAQNPACDCVVVRAKIEVDPLTAALTITTDPSGPHAIPHLIDGVPVQIKKVNVLVNRERFTFNPTNCNPMSLTGSINSDEGASESLSIPFQAANCAVLKYEPKFAVTTAAKASKTNGARLTFKIVYPKNAMGAQAWFNEAKFTIPRQLPSRLETIQQACLAATFERNRSACPAASIIGHAVVHTQVLPVPLKGPVYFVSYGSAKFPDAVVVLEGYGITVELHGETFIKNGVTSATFRNLPDVPFESIEVTIPTGRYSEFGANLPHGSDDFCGQKLVMPTFFKASDGREMHGSNPVQVSGCPKTLTAKQRLAAALERCRKNKRNKRPACETSARKQYGPKKTTKARGHSSK